MSSLLTPITELASIIRSKNAKAFHLTFDIIFRDAQAYERVKSAQAITPEMISQIYRTPVMEFHWFDAGHALKVTIRRPHAVGGIGESDVFGCQQHAPLLGLSLHLPTESLASPSTKPR